MEDMIGKKRKRDETEKLIYQKLCIPYKEDEENYINYILSQIKSEYSEAIQYSLKFGDIADDITAFCLWGNFPLYDGVIASLSKKIEINDIANWVNSGKKQRTFDFFINIQCLLNVDNNNKILSIFENGRYGFLWQGKKDYFLLMSIKSLNKFDFITINNEYCQFWLIKIEKKELLDILNLKPINKSVLKLSTKIKEYEIILKEKDSIIRNQINEYNERINKIVKQKNENYEKIKKDNEKKTKEINNLTEKIININKNKNKNIRVKKFLGLKIFENINFEYLVNYNIIDIEEYVNETDENGPSEDKLNEDLVCIICFKRKRNIFFEKCGHCCLCEECLRKTEHKIIKKIPKIVYSCPICNNETKNGEFTTARNIYFS